MKKIWIKGLAVVLCANLFVAPISYLDWTESVCQVQAASSFGRLERSVPSYSNQLVTGSVRVPDPVHQIAKTDTEGNFLQFQYLDDAGNPVDMESSGQISDKEAWKKWTRNKAAVTTKASYNIPNPVTPVKNQGIWNTCWAFAATAAMEANIIKNKAGISTVKADASLDLSESHLAWFAHNTYSTNSSDISYGDGLKKTDSMKVYGGNGGQDYKTAYYLARGSGMNLEQDTPYHAYDIMDPLLENTRYSSVVQIHDFCRTGYKADSVSIARVKELVSTYGAATAGYYSAESGYRTGSDGRLSYCSLGYQNSGIGVAHETCIVGWNDDYAVSNFVNTPKAKGAWLVKNSWGTDWSKDGYFWMSYYEPTLNSAGAFSMMDGNTYSQVYQYSADDSNDYYETGKETTAANIYRAKQNEVLKHVGIETESRNMKASVSVYVSAKKPTTPVSGELAATVTVSDLGWQGFHLIDLPNELPLTKGQYFSVILTLQATEKSTAFFPTEQNGRKKAGQTYYYTSDGRWVDATNRSMSKYKNAKIYAYTSDKNPDRALLDQYIAEAKALNRTDVLYYAGQDRWNQIQAELEYAKTVEERQAVDRAVRALGNAISHASSKNMYRSLKTGYGPGSQGVQLYKNGGTVKRFGVSNQYKSCSLYPDFYRARSWVWKDKKKTDVKAVLRGKYVAAVTKHFRVPTLGLDGTVQGGVDEEAAQIVKAKVSGSKVVITPLQEGEVYVWMLWYPKSDAYQSDALSKQAAHYAVAKVKVGTAPTNLRLYLDDSIDPVSGDTGSTGMTLPAGESTDLYVKGTTGGIKKTVNTIQEIVDPDVDYYYTVSAKYAPYVQVSQDSRQHKHFRVTVAKEILELAKPGKTLSVPVTFCCDRNSKKKKFTFKIGNPVQRIQISATEGKGTAVSQEAGSIAVVALDSAQSASQTGYITEEKTLYHSDLLGTDSVSIIRIPSPDGFTFTATGGIRSKGVVSAQQKKVSFSAVIGQPGNYKVTASKGTQPGTEAYFILFHNAYRRSSGTGYQIIKVVAGAAELRSCRENSLPGQGKLLLADHNIQDM